MIEFKCELCGKDANLPKARYERIQKFSDILCCTECNWKKIPIMKKETKKVTCEECNNSFKESKFKIFLHLKDPQRRKLICPSCNQFVKARCSRCGKTYDEKKYRVTKYGTRTMCKECNDFIRKTKGM